MFYPVYDVEPGDEAPRPLVELDQFPADLDSLQLNYIGVDNPWDLKKVQPGQTDPKTGEEKKQKSMIITALIGTRYDLAHVIQISYSSLLAHGCYLRKKDVEALCSKTVFGLAGTPAEWSSVLVLTRLHSELEKHEEWM